MIDRPDHLDGTDVAIYEDDGQLYGLDSYGEFELDPPAGSSEPQDGRCNTPLKLTEERYGEIRYCGAMPVGAFAEYADVNYDHMDRCRQHQNVSQLMENVVDLITHGAFGRNYVLFERSLDATEFLLAVDMFAGLLDTSKYDFDVVVEERTVDAGDDPIVEEEAVIVRLPIPTAEKYQAQANELWYFALDEIVEQRMQNIRLMEGVSSSHVVATADDDGTITDTIEEASEHHLNLPISRLSKDKKDRLKIGGVEIGADDDGGILTFQQNDYTLDVSPTDSDAPEMDTPLSEQLEPDDAEDE